MSKQDLALNNLQGLICHNVWLTFFRYLTYLRKFEKSFQQKQNQEKQLQI